MDERTFATAALELNYAVGPPNGRPFVVLHGGAARWQYGEAFLNLLENQWQVYAPDLRGHGKSGRVRGAYTLGDYVPDIAAFLTSVVGQPAVVYGHSLGGEVSVMLASRHPDLVRGLIVGDSPLSARSPANRAQNELWRQLAGQPVQDIVPALKEIPIDALPARIVFGEDNPWFEHQALSLHQLDPDMLAAVLTGPETMLAGYEPEVLLPAVSCPVLLLQADALTDDEVALAIRLLPNATHLRLEGLGHPLHGPEPQRVFDAIRPFLEQLPP